MQGHADGLACVTVQFDGGGTYQLIERGLGGPVAVPAAETVVADRAHAGRQGGEHRLAVSRHQRQEVFHQQGRSDRIDGEGMGQVPGIELAIGLLGHEFIVMQEAGGIEDQPQRFIAPAKLSSGFGDAVFIRDIQRRVGVSG